MRFWLCFVLGVRCVYGGGTGAGCAAAEGEVAPWASRCRLASRRRSQVWSGSRCVSIQTGREVVEKCDAGRAICDLAIEAIGQAEFEPATRDGTPVPSEISVELRVRKPVGQDAPAGRCCRNPARTRKGRSRKRAGLLRNRRGGCARAGADQARARWNPKHPRYLRRAVSNSRDDAGHRAGRQRSTLRLRSWRPAVGDGLPLRRHSRYRCCFTPRSAPRRCTRA